MLSRRNLTEIQRHRSRNNTRSQTSDDSTDHHHGQVNGSRLYDGAEAEDRDADEARPSSSTAIVGGTREECETDELSSVEDGGDEALVA
jgi:hypothetical protein